MIVTPFIMLSVGVILILKFMTLPLSLKSLLSKEKAAPFECGFDPISKSRSPFSYQFFLLAVMFLIFDIEIGLIMALPIASTNNMTTEFLLPTISFLFLLLLGLNHEWNEGSLQWKAPKS